MKKTITIVAITTLMVLLAGCSIMKKNKVEESYAGLETRVYEIFGMDCPACASGLDKLVEKNPAVKKSEADWKGKKLTVYINPDEKLQDEDIVDAVNKANFTPGKRIQ